MTLFIRLLIALFAGHALCDYPLQGDFLAKGKNNQIPGVPWMQCLFAHCIIHAAMVLILTGSLTLAFAEFTIHMVTDYAKTKNWISFNTDQAIHYGCKILWAAIIAWAVAG